LNHNFFAIKKLELWCLRFVWAAKKAKFANMTLNSGEELDQRNILLQVEQLIANGLHKNSAFLFVPQRLHICEHKTFQKYCFLSEISVLLSTVE